MEENLRKLLFNLEIISNFTKAKELGTESPIFKNVINSLELIEKLKKELGFLEDKSSTFLKQSKFIF